MALKVYTGSRVSDGRVIYLDAAGGWTEAVDEARLIAAADEPDAAALAEKAAADAIVADPYPIDVTEEAGRVRPVRFRERIRAFGPPVHPDFVKTPPTEADHFAPGGRPASGDGA